MPFIAPLVAGALGLGAIGTAIVEVGLAVGLSFAAQKLRPKVKNSASANATGVRLGLKIDTNPTRQFLVGETATTGSLAYWQLSGADNNVLHLVYAHADHECTSLQSVIVDGKTKTRDSGTGQVEGYGDKLVVRFYSGASGQTADAELTSTSEGRWTSNDVGVGVCYSVVRLTYDETLFPGGIPDLGFVIRGAKLIDPRTGALAWSDNPAVILYNILRGVSVAGEKLIGMNVPAEAIRASDVIAAANACDELVALKAGGTEKRYRCGDVFGCDQTNRDIIETILASMAGEMIEAGGIYRIMAGVAQTPVAHLTDADLIVSEPLVTRTKRGRNEIVNAMYGSFTDPSRAYQSVALPPRTSAADEADDGGIRLSRTVDLGAVQSRAQGQRVLEIERRRARRMGSASMRVRARWWGLEPGDWVTFSSDRRGYAEKTFIVQTRSGARDLTSDIVLVETDAAIDDWTASTDEIDDDQVIDLASAGPSLSAVTGIDVDAIVVTGASGEQRPGLSIVWTPITDATVVSLRLEYRKVGGTVALERTIVDPSAGSYSWLDGVQGGVTYEARLRPVTMPERSTTWSSWYSSASASAPQIVSVAAYADYTNPANLPPAYLGSAQERFEISLSTALGTVQGSLAEREAEMLAQIERVSHALFEHRASFQDTRARVVITEQTLQSEIESFAQYKVDTTASLNDKASAQAVTDLTSRVTTAEGALTAQGQAVTAVQAELPNKASTSAVNMLQSRVTNNEGAISAQATQVSTLQTTVGGHTNSINQITQLDGANKRYTMVFGSDGKFFKVIEINGTAELLEMIFGSTSVKIFDPLVANGEAKPFFSAQSINGVNKFVLDGDVWARHLLVDSLTSITASFGDATVTGILSGGPTGKLKLDFTNGRIRATT